MLQTVMMEKIGKRLAIVYALNYINEETARFKIE